MTARLIAALALFSLALPATAYGQTKCMPHDVADETLGERYGEQPIGLGLGTNGSSVIEVYVAESGTWTILVTRTNGMSCIAAAGENWTDLPRGTVVAEEGT